MNTFYALTLIIIVMALVIMLIWMEVDRRRNWDGDRRLETGMDRLLYMNPHLESTYRVVRQRALARG